MKFCPKCRSFYKDANLAFCLTDGIPLVEINQSNSLWSEGTNAIETSHKIAFKKARRQKFAKISRTLVMMILLVMVISVVAMNIYVNFPNKVNEIAESSTPSPMPSFTPKQAETAIVETSPSPTQTATNTPSPTPTKMPSLTPTKTASPSPSPKETIFTPVCPANEVTAFIRKNYFERWQGVLRRKIPEFQERFATENNIKINNTRGELFFEDYFINAVPSKNCQSANVTIKFTFVISPIQAQQVNTKMYRFDEPKKCTRNGSGWVCP